jgi:hypothetical protein
VHGRQKSKNVKNIICCTPFNDIFISLLVAVFGFGRQHSSVTNIRRFFNEIHFKLLSRSLVVVVNPFYLAFSLSFPCRFLFVFTFGPAEEAAGAVPFSSKFQRDGSYIPSGLSGCARKLHVSI